MGRPLASRRILGLALGLVGLLSACGPGGGSGGGGSGGGTGAPAKASHRTLSITDGKGAPVIPNVILKQRFAVARGEDVVFFTTTGGDVYGTPDSVIVRVGKDGTVKWAKKLRFPENAFVQSAADDGQGVTFVAGQDATAYVVRLDDSGAIRAQQAYETDGGGQLSGTTPFTIVPTKDGGLLVSAGSMFRLAADLSIAWTKNVSMAVQRMAELPDGDIALVGEVGGMRVVRLSPEGEPRFVGLGGIKGNFSHAGISPLDDGGFLVVSGVDASDDLVATVTGVVSKDGTTASFKGVQMFVQDDVNNVTLPMQFGGGFHVERAANGRVWASVEASSGGVGAAYHAPFMIGFDGQEPVDAFVAGLAFALQDSTIVAISPGMDQDHLFWVPRPEDGQCTIAPYKLAAQELPNQAYSAVPNPMFFDFAVTLADGAAVPEDLTATLSAELCE